MDKWNLSAWIGVREVNGKWVAINGKPLEETGYDVWYIKTRDHIPQPDQCLSFYATQNKNKGLETDKCGATFRRYICEKPVVV